MGNPSEVFGDAVKQQTDGLVLGYPTVGSSFFRIFRDVLSATDRTGAVLRFIEG